MGYVHFPIGSFKGSVPLTYYWWVFWSIELVRTQLTTDFVAPCQHPELGLSLVHPKFSFDIPFLVVVWLKVDTTVWHTLFLMPKRRLINMIRLGNILLEQDLMSLSMVAYSLRLKWARL